MKILPNGVAVIDGDTHHAIWCAEEGLIHDKFASKILRQIIRDEDVQVCVDIGAHFGTLTAVMIEEGCEVYAFEPNPKAFECLKHNCPAANHIMNACGDKVEEVEMEILANAGASYIGPGTGERVKVTTMTLDELGLVKVGLIKLDVEGFEVKALHGAQDTIHRCRPVLFCEVNREALRRAGASDMELITLIRGMGYKTKIAQPDCFFGDPQYDIICTPQPLR